jgi:rhamnosyltransferase
MRSLGDVKLYGSYTFFCSDSWAAYSQMALDRVGGFEATLSHEDYFTVAKILNNGGRIAYVAEAGVIHSHKYSLWQDFQRYFDAGYVRAVNPWVTKLVGPAENHGSRFFTSMLKRLAKEDPKLIPYALIQTLTKWLGYRIGYFCFRGPTWLKKILSGQSYYFDSKYYEPGKN